VEPLQTVAVYHHAEPGASTHSHPKCTPPPTQTHKHPTQTTSGAAATSERLHKETELAIQQVQSDVKTSKSKVVDMLVRYATTVSLQQ